MLGLMSGLAAPEPVWGEPARCTVSEALHRACEHPLLARLLASRGCLDADLAHAFLEPVGTFDPVAVPGVDAAVERLIEAIARGQRVLVWGDFDADGQTATAVLVTALHR